MKIRKPSTVLLGLIIGFAVLTAVALLRPLSPPPFVFIYPDHPVDMRNDQTGTWAYYAVDAQPGLLAAKARAELFAKGYTEDFKSKPWFRFVKGTAEVIICNSSQTRWEIGPDSSACPRHLVRHSSFGALMDDITAVVLVRGPKLSEAYLLDFKLKKLFYSW